VKYSSLPDCSDNRAAIIRKEWLGASASSFRKRFDLDALRKGR
jgi:hypothetical protein